MKGMVFTEFMEMVERRFGVDMVDDLIDETLPASGGVYTSVGTYDHHELLGYVGKLSERTGTAPEVLVRAFANELFPRLASMHGSMLSSDDSLFAFLESLDGHIHVEVKKLYPGAELPKIETSVSDDGKTLRMAYVSARRLDEFAHGLIEGAIEHFGETAEISRESLEDGRPGCVFVIERTG